MANYESSIMEPTEVAEFCKLCNSDGYTIISCVPLADSQQILLIIDRPQKAFTQKKVEPEPIKPENRVLDFLFSDN